jgi:nitrite reductase (NO-forming)
MRRRSFLVALALSVAMLPACGGGGKSSSPPCPAPADPRAAVNGEVTVCALDIKFDVKQITAPAGPLKITLINKGAQAHTLKVDGTDFEIKTPSHNDVKTGTVTLTAGSHKYVCTIAGHEAAGMKGTIVVS